MDNQDLELKLMINKFGLSQADFSKKNLSNFPEKVFLLHKLEVLLASGNKFISIPSQIGKLRKLKVVDISHNKVRNIPETFSNCTNVIELYFQCNRISNLTLHFENFRRLKCLQLSDNLLEALPLNFGNAVSLKWLDISKNSIWKLPKTFSLLINLIHLNVSGNAFIDFPMQLVSLHKLESLDISHNKINNLPPDLSSLKCLRRINVSFNQFSTFPASICDLKRLEYLDISNNQLKSISSRLSKLHRLKVFLISNNFLSHLLDNLPSIEILNVADNALKNLSVINMKSMKQLIASKNLLESMPVGVYNLHNLEELYISDNKITHISQDVIRLNKLKRFNISGNTIKLVPKVLYEMESLNELNLSGDFKRIKNGFNSKKRIAAISMDSVQKLKINNSNKLKSKKQFNILKLFSFNKSTKTRNQKHSDVSQNLNFQNSEFYFPGSSQNLNRSKSHQKLDENILQISKQAWSDGTNDKMNSRLDGDEVEFLNLSSLKPFHEVEYPGHHWIEVPPRQSSIRFQEDHSIINRTLSSDDNIHPQERNNRKTLNKQYRRGQVQPNHHQDHHHQNQHHHDHHKNHHRSHPDVGRRINLKDLQKNHNSFVRSQDFFDDSDEEFQLSTQKNNILSSQSKLKIKQKSKMESEILESYHDDNLSTTVTVDDDVGDRLSLGDDDFEFHPTNLKDRKLLEVAQTLEELLGNQILKPYVEGKKSYE